MFEEVCLVCGKHLKDDGRAYCSDGCENLDFTSPSISSTSSALSSPHTSYAFGGDVPALLPSTLGPALTKSRNRHSMSSSSSSSVSLSLATDLDENDPHPSIIGERSPDSHEFAYDAASKSSGHSSQSSPFLYYARQPSGVNNRYTVPHLHKRQPSTGSFPQALRGMAKSAPSSSSSTTGDENYSDAGTSQHIDQVDQEVATSEVLDHNQGPPTSKRNRNRTSLPAYFSLLQVSSPKDGRRSPVSSSSGHTIARISPPTPKLSLKGLAAHYSSPSQTENHNASQATPKGRGRTTRDSRISFHSSRSSSSSRSRSGVRAGRTEPRFGLRVDGGGIIDRVMGWTTLSTMRRGGSPSQRQCQQPGPVEETSHIPVSKRSQSSGHQHPTDVRPRGRLRVEDLDGLGGTTVAPGYGHGRSGLLDRERSTQNGQRMQYF